MKLFAALFSILLFATCAVAQTESCNSVHPICISPPPPPVFNSGYMSIEENDNDRESSAYSIPFDTVRYNSTLGQQAFDIVICFDGVTNNTQITKGDRYVDSLVKSLQTLQHYQQRFNYFNIYRVARYSNDEGAAWGFAGDTTVDNRYGSRFNAFGLPRLIVPEKPDTLFADADEFVPDADLILVLVFDKKYGGSGWRSDSGRAAAMFTIDEETGWFQGDEVALHEMQHIMPFNGHGYPGDEYEDTVACKIYATIPPSPNVTADTSGNRKWEHCSSIPGIGFYPHAGICEGNYKPSTTCLMQTVFTLPQLCPVCRENSIAWLDSMINPVYYTSAPPDSFKGNYMFSALVDTPAINNYRYQWLLNDSLVTQGSLSLNIDFATIDNSKNHILKFVCTDTDSHIIDTTLRRPWVTQWTLLTSGLPVNAENYNAEVAPVLYPNPASNSVTVRLPGYNGKPIQLYITDINGRLIKELTLNTTETTIDIAELKTGVYLINARNNSISCVSRLLKW